MAKRRGYGVRKRLTDWGVHRGPKQTFRPMPRPLEPNIVLTDEKLRVHPNVFWFGAAALYSIAGVLPLVLAALHAMAPDMPVPKDGMTTLTIAVGCVAIALSGFWIYLASRNMPALPWMNFIVGIGTALIGAIAVAAEGFAPDLLTLFLMPAMAAAFFMPFRQAAGHLLAIVAIDLYVAFSSDTTSGTIIGLNILFFTLMSASMLMIARKHIQDGIVHNVALAGRDPLTGVPNLRKFNDRLQAEVLRAQRTSEPLTLLMIDLDDFKLVNDEYSYTLGDAVLVASARAMDEVVRGDEMLARRGGDEFAVIAVGADLERADALASRLKLAIRRERLKLCPDVTAEASVGLAELRGGEAPESLVRRADSALHVSKIVAHSSEPFAET